MHAFFATIAIGRLTNAPANLSIVQLVNVTKAVITKARLLVTESRLYVD